LSVADFGRGFDVTNLRKMRQLYRVFEIRDAPRLVSAVEAVRLTDRCRALPPCRDIQQTEKILLVMWGGRVIRPRIGGV
jgi:hypothetical protein